MDDYAKMDFALQAERGEKFWLEFCKRKGVDAGETHTVWAFCGGGKMADELLDLVIEGKKFGTASIYEDYISQNEPVPGRGEYSVVTDSRGVPACVVRNFDVTTVPFLSVTEYHGFSEGEEERNLAAWRRIHGAYWAEDIKNLGLESVYDCRAVCEKFTVEYVSPEFGGRAEDEYFLTEPNSYYAEQIWDYREEMLLHGSRMDGCLSLASADNAEEWIGQCANWSAPGSDAASSGTVLMCIRKSDGKIVGMIQITAKSEKTDIHLTGRIGYSVRPCERGRGIAKLMLEKALIFTKYTLSESECEISVLKDNIPSRKTVEHCGGIYRDTVLYGKDGVMLDRYTVDLSGL